jgi:glutamyl-tRNA synthetase
LQQGITKGPDGAITALSGELNPAGDPKKTKLKLTWLADVPELVPLTLVDFGYLITKKKVEEEDDFKALINPDSRWEAAAVGDVNMGALKKGEVLQLERKGYYIVDAPAGSSGPGSPAVLLSIPDGRTKQPSGSASSAASVAGSQA